MPIDAADTFRRGGKDTVDFLQFAIVSARPAAVFVYLVTDYKTRPSAVGAVALYEQFCHPRSPAVVVPADVRLTATITPIRNAIDGLRAFVPTAEQPDPPIVPIPAGYLFDGIVAQANPLVAATAADFSPERGPIGSLPGGKMSEGQRAFVNQTWMKRVRPALVAAGFWRVGTLGQP